MAFDVTLIFWLHNLISCQRSTEVLKKETKPFKGVHLYYVTEKKEPAEHRSERLRCAVIKYTVGNLWVVHQYQEPLFILNFSRFSFFLEFRLQPETLSDIFTPMEKAKFDPVNGNDCTAEEAWTHSGFDQSLEGTKALSTWKRLRKFEKVHCKLSPLVLKPGVFIWST